MATDDVRRKWTRQQQQQQQQPTNVAARMKEKERTKRRAATICRVQQTNFDHTATVFKLKQKKTKQWRQQDLLGGTHRWPFSLRLECSKSIFFDNITSPHLHNFVLLFGRPTLGNSVLYC